ncbi:MAG TPA: ABC transporter ATP-binding protein [Caulobacteraceae bacterium]|jgi:ABC-type multidrug transport system fused ATPase/permease subunit
MRPGAWKHAAGLIRANPWSFGASLGFYVGFFTLTLAPGLINREIFDTLSGRGRAGANVWTLIALVVGLSLGRFGLLYCGGVLFNVFRYVSEALLKRNMLDWLVSAPGPRTLPGSPGEVVSRFRDDTLETVGLSTILIVSPQVATGVVAFAIMLRIDAVITVVVALPMLAAVAINYLLTRRIQRYRKAAREATAAVTSFIGETFAAAQSIKLAGAEARVIGRLKGLNERRRAASIRDLMFASTMGVANANLSALATGCVLLLAAGAMRRGAFTVGDFTLFANYLALVSAAPVLVGQILATERQSGVSLARMRELTADAPPLQLVARRTAAPPRPALAAEPLQTLAVRGLSCRHPASGRGIEAVDLEVRRGAFVVVTGRVGAGKSTLLRALLGLAPAHAGEILWNGRPVADLARFMTPPRCAYTAQAPRLFSESLRDNILMGEAATAEALAEAVSLAVFDEDVAGFDAGLETLVGTRGVTLSGGQLQRAAAARMFLRRPDLLVFDDISSALDVATEQALWRGLFADGRRTCLAVSHRREAFRRADQILVLDEGRVAARGTAETLRRASPLFRSIWDDEDD